MSELPAQVEVWKKIVDVQQHFNDLELRIRNFALIVTGAFIGLGGYAIKDGGFARVLGFHISVAGLVVSCSLLPLLAFYLMDRLWYHRLLDGAVKAATPVEARLRELGLTVDLGAEISRASPFEVRGRKVRSKHKMDWFYGIIASGITLLSAILAFGVKPSPLSVTTGTPVYGQPPHSGVVAATLASAQPSTGRAPTPTAIGGAIMPPAAQTSTGQRSTSAAHAQRGHQPQPGASSSAR